jgi:hypothetical protein
MWASIVSVIVAWEKSAKMLEQLMEAYLLWRVDKIRSEYDSVNKSREEIIKQINLARAQRDQVKLINLSRALYLVEYAGVQLNKNQAPASPNLHSP